MWLVVLGVVLLLVWPLQIILAAIFLGAGAVVVTAATAGLERRLDAQTSTARRVLLRRRIRDVAFALAAVGLVLIVLWPATMAITTLLVALLAFGALAYLRWRHPEWWSL